MGLARQDERERHEGSPVAAPRGQCGQAREVGVALDDAGHGPTPPALEADAGQGESEVALGPELRGRRRERLLGQACDALHELLGPVAEGQPHAFRAPEEVGDGGKAAPFGLLKRIAGPSAAITRRWTSAISSRGSTSASISTSSPASRRRPRKARRSVGAGRGRGMRGAWRALRREESQDRGVRAEWTGALPERARYPRPAGARDPHGPFRRRGSPRPRRGGPPQRPLPKSAASAAARQATRDT